MEPSHGAVPDATTLSVSRAVPVRVAGASAGSTPTTTNVRRVMASASTCAPHTGLTRKEVAPWGAEEQECAGDTIVAPDAMSPPYSAVANGG